MKKFKLSDEAGCGLALAGLYLGATLAVNVAAMPIVAGFNGIERVVGGRESVQNARLIQKGNYATPNIGVNWGRFVNAKGDTLVLYDTADIPSGKIFGNSQIDRAEVGREYSVTALNGPLSNKLIKLSSSTN